MTKGPRQIHYLPTLLTIFPNPEDATSFMRGAGVFGRIKGVNHVQGNKISWVELGYTDAFFMQRPFGNNLYTACKIAKRNKLPIWLDYDDNLSCLPKWSPSYDHFEPAADQLEMIEMIKMADVVSVTTEKLVEFIKQYNKSVVLVPNALNDFVFDFKYAPGTNPILNWRGSPFHKGDITTIEDGFKYVNENHPDWSLVLIGPDSKHLKDVKFISLPVQDIVEYYESIQAMSPKLWVVPLEDNEFNHSKSNLAWIEATYAGATVLAPSVFKEFDRPGIVRYDNIEHFNKLVTELMNDDIMRIARYKESYEFIKNNLLLSNVNHLRVEILSRLV